MKTFGFKSQATKIFLYSGVAISFILIAIIFSKIDWNLFFETIKNIQWGGVILAFTLIIFGVLIRSFRWVIISTTGLGNFSFFWEAYNLGYLGNLIYPARAGELLRIIAIHKFAGISEGHAFSSSFVDRLSDGIMLPLFILILIIFDGHEFQIPWIINCFATLFIILVFFLIAFIIWGKEYEEWIIKKIGFLPQGLTQRIVIWYSQIHDSVSSLKDFSLFCQVIVLSIFAFIIDSTVFFVLFDSFGLSLPFTAAILLGIFIFAGSILPSVPGYFGIYQIACILALQPFGVSGTEAVAYSLTLQCIAYVTFLLTGGWIIYSKRLSLDRMGS